MLDSTADFLTGNPLAFQILGPSVPHGANERLTARIPLEVNHAPRLRVVGRRSPLG